MEKRLVVFLVLSIAIIFTYPYFIGWWAGPQVLPPAEQTTKVIENKQEKKGEVKKEEIPLPSSGGPEKKYSREGEKEKVIESDLYRVTLSNIGGTIKGWELKKYTKKEADGTVEPIKLVPEGAKTFPLTVVGSKSADNQEIYSLDTSPLQLNSGTPDATVEMSFIGSDGKKIRKELKFHHDQYIVDVKFQTEGYSDDLALSLGTNFGVHDWGQQFGGSLGAISLINGELAKDSPTKVSGTVTHEGVPAWLGLQDKYFIGALIPKPEEKVGPVLVEKEGDQALSVRVKLGDRAGSRTNNFSLYVGPKEYDRLTRLGVHLEESIDFGWFIAGSWLPVRLIAKPIFYLLRFFYQFTNNYGVAIILVTVLVKTLFFPITRKSLISMKAMSSVQPKVAAIRKKWANDKEKMNKELMNLYKTEKINPLGGCLPMLVQIPVFIALFNILYTTIDLRQAPFLLWIHDLSAMDPYYVLPIIMGISMFFQQYTQPSTMDPTQAKVMLFLPGIYTFFFLKFPAGLVLYWLVNNILSIVQQYLMKREGVAVPKEGTA
jgi:YidC/Oxa1 family membrane protein insertase